MNSTISPVFSISVGKPDVFGLTFVHRNSASRGIQANDLLER